MEQFLKNLSSQEWFITFVSFMTANVGIILLGVIKMIRLKISNNELLNNLSKLEKEAINNIDAKYEEKQKQLQEALIAKLDLVDEKITNKLKLEKQENRERVERAEQDFQDAIDAIVNDIKLDNAEVGE